MTDEERQSTIDFILQQQARTTVHVEELQEYRRRNEPQWDAFQKSFVQLVELTRIMDERMDNGDLRITAVETRSDVLETSMAELAKAQARADEARRHADEVRRHADEAHARLVEANAHLADAHAHLEGRVSALIDFIIEGRNGPS